MRTLSRFILGAFLITSFLAFGASVDSVRTISEDRVLLTGKEALLIQKGTTAERPASSVAGMMRYNTETGFFEFYNGASWGSPVGAAEFSDAIFRIVNDADGTKMVGFDASGITTATDRTIILQDSDGTMPLLEAVQTWSAINSFSSDLLLTGTGQIKLPVGTTAERSVSPSVGMTRYNSDLNDPEVYNGSSWVSLGSASKVQGPVSATDNAIPRYDGTSGQLVKDSGVLVDDDNRISIDGTGSSTFVGFNSGTLDDGTANQNTSLGNIALRDTTTGANNVAIGFSASAKNTTGSNNTAIGAGTLSNVTTGIQNTVIGSQSATNAIGSRLTAIGYNSQASSTSGIDNVTAGANTLASNLTGQDNVVIGNSAGQYSGGSDNVYLGNEAGLGSSLNSNARNIFIGSQAGDSANNANDNILIGHDIDLPSPSSTNFMSIDNLLYGDLANKRIGINVSSPLYSLDVLGNSNISGSLNVTSTLTSSTLNTAGDAIIGGTGQVDIPAGTTAERTPTPNSGMIRYNTDLSEFEGYSSGQWILMTGGSSGGLAQWETAITYGVGDVIYDELTLKIFRANTAHVADATFAADFGLGYWDEVSSGIADIGISTDSSIALWDGVTGELLKDSGVTIIDEDDMISDSATAVPTQQSVKAYVDSRPASTLQAAYDTSTDGTITLDATRTGIAILDNSTSIELPLFQVLSNDELTNYFTVDLLNINTAVDFVMSGTGYFKLPVGTTLERPTASTGMTRFNSDEDCLEIYNATEWVCVGTGGGGSSGINFLVDPSFEAEELAFTTTASPLEQYLLYTADTELYSEFNTKYYNLSWTFPFSTNLSIKKTIPRTGLDGEQGLFVIWIKSDRSDLEACVTVDDATFSGACSEENTLTLDGTGVWKKYEVAFTFGAASVDFRIVNGAITGSLDISFDNLYIGTAPEGYVPRSTVAGAILVADPTTPTKLAYSTAIQGVLNPVTDWVSYTPTISAGFGAATLLSSKYRRVGDSAEIELFFVGGTTAPSLGSFSLPTGLSVDTSKLTISNNNTAQQGTMVGYYEISEAVSNTNGKLITAPATDGNLIYFGQSSRNSVNGLIPANVTSIMASTTSMFAKVKVPIQGWTSGLDAVAQNIELNANNSNVLTAIVSSTGTIVTDTLDFINGNCVLNTPSTNNIRCTFNAGVFTQTPICRAQAYPIANRSSPTVELDSGKFAWLSERTDTAVGITPTTNFTIVCHKDGNDINRSQVITATLQGINSSDLIKITASGSLQGSITALNPVDFDANVTGDSWGAWSGTAFTVPENKAGRYNFSGSISNGTAQTTLVLLYINGVGAPQAYAGYNGASTNTHIYNINADLVAGDVVTIRTDRTQNYQNVDSSHYLNITQTADYEAIVKNLSEVFTECQTKYLSADIGVVSGISDLQFNNLIIGKKYEVRTVFRYAPTAQDTGIFDSKNGGNVVCRNSVFSDPGDTPNPSIACKFQATATTLTHDSISLTGTSSATGNGTNEETYVELCELPDSTIINSTRFN